MGLVEVHLAGHVSDIGIDVLSCTICRRCLVVSTHTHLLCERFRRGNLSSWALFVREP